MHDIFSRRLFLQRGALLGTTVSFSSMLLAGCGDSEATTGQATEGSRVAPTPAPSSTPAGTTQWRSLRIGAGGWVTGIDISRDGTKVVRCDTFGAYIWTDSTSSWTPLLTATSLPAGEWGPDNPGAGGVYEVAVAPSDSTRIYAITNGLVFKSADRGRSFTRTTLARFAANPNDDFKTFGRKMAVDPANPEVVYVGTQTGGLSVTVDGGKNWSTVAAVPASVTGAGVIIAFDPSSGVVGRRTKRVYVSSQGRGVYVSNDAGATFTLTPNSPTAHRHMVCDQKGVLWLTDASLSDRNLKRFAGGAWSTTGAAGSQFHSIAVDPANANHVVTADNGGSLCQSFDGGATWTGIYYSGYPSGSGARAATDIPWLAWTNESYLSNGDMRFDPSASNKLVFAEGIGVWTTNPPSSYAAFTWTSQSRGIEQLVSNLVISPPGGVPLYFAWDRPVFRLNDLSAYPATHGPNRNHSIVMGWSGDYAIDNSAVVAGVMNWYGAEESAFSTDGGVNWTRFGSVPAEVASGKIGGSIAVSTSNNLVWLPEGNASPYYSQDRGSTWTQVRISGVPTGGETGWGQGYWLNRQALAADKAVAGTFYLYNYLSSCVGLYRSSDGGVSWTRVYASEIAPVSAYNAKLSAVPGKAGHLFFTSGNLDGANPYPSKFMRSVDGGASWSEVSNVLEVYACGFGKAAAGRDYPAIYLAGYVNRVWGLWRSDDNAVTWTKIGDYPLGNFDLVKTVSGDMNVYGRVYVGLAGSGGVYGDLGAA